MFFLLFQLLAIIIHSLRIERKKRKVKSNVMQLIKFYNQKNKANNKKRRRRKIPKFKLLSESDFFKLMEKRRVS